MNITEVFLAAAKQYPQHIAIKEKHQVISYQDLAQDVQKTAQYFQDKGIQKGDRVLVFVPMSIDLYRIVLALFYMGATAVFLDEWVNKSRLDICCQLADCKGFISGLKVRILSVFSKEIRKIPIKLSLRKKSNSMAPMTHCQPSESALITFTTGSTGIPKAADRTHDFLRKQFDALIEKIDPQPTDIDMPTLPIVLLVNLGAGSTSVIADFKMTKPDKLNPQKIIHQLSHHQVNRITASPFFVKKISQAAIQAKTPIVNIQKIFTGGAPVFPCEAKLYTQAFPNAVSTIVYGSTEAEPISSITAQVLAQRDQDLSIGLPVGKKYHKISLRIINITDQTNHSISLDELDSMSLPEGKIGEIIVAGPHVLKQYFKNDLAFRTNKIVVGETIWHRTGDSGLLKNGELFLTGRCQQLIPSQNGYLSPFIIENQLQNIDAISMGTLLLLKNQKILVVETTLNKEILTSRLPVITHNRLVIQNPIPRDPRHHSKIDYKALEALVE